MKTLLPIFALMILWSCGGSGGGGSSSETSTDHTEAAPQPEVNAETVKQRRALMNEMETLWKGLQSDLKSPWKNPDRFNKIPQWMFYGKYVQENNPEFSLEKNDFILSAFMEARMKYETPDFNKLANKMIKEKIK
jgi:hypothetical protein